MNINWTDVKTFFINQSEVTKIQLNGTTLWQKSSGPTPPTPTPDYTEPFYLEDLSGSANEIWIYRSSSNSPTITIETSTDKTTWSTLGTTANTLGIPLSANGKVYIRCTTNRWTTGYSGYLRFGTYIGNYKVGGNIMSLLYGSNFTGQETSFPTSDIYTFYYLFYNNSYLKSAGDLLLPATTLNERCYSSMFSNCTSLISIPELPAVTLSNYCYERMFQSCASLTQAPILPSTTLAIGCYTQMFEWCSSLTTAPDLPAATLKDYCYSQMFHGCTNLNYVKCLATNRYTSDCTYYWLNNVSSTGTFVKDVNATWSTGNYGVPSGWTVQDAS